MERLKLAIVIPALNEENTIGTIVESILTHGIAIVVDDGSCDNTAKVAKDAGAIVVRHPYNLGYDGALNSGFEKAISMSCDVILTFDADGQHSVALIDDFLSEIDRGADVVVGIRNRRARLSEIIFSWISTKLWNIKDPQCGMKAYRSSVYNRLGYFDSYGSIGTELCIFAAKNNFEIAQVPFEVNERVDEPRFGGSLSANWKVFRAIAFGILK